ncbi:hypothetical protein JVU11DRAFT_11438 [Chiua virens]|nr:hypothetical protein JVU11DRAFT_11438 [Chiua virens]
MTPGTPWTRFIVIGQAIAAGESDLKLVCSSTASRPSHASRVQNPAVLGSLKNSARTNGCTSDVSDEKQPFESAFALHDGPFTIRRIFQRELEKPKFVYLSACHTTVWDKESPDEIIHLAAAMPIVGFRSVIGAMWAVGDGQTNKITSTFTKTWRHGQFGLS